MAQGPVRVSETRRLRFDYSALESDTCRFVQDCAEKIHNPARMTAAAIVQIGQHLAEVKERIGHGRFWGGLKGNPTGVNGRLAGS
jgi:hypothetical protein